MMRSNSFETQEEKERPEESRRVERLFILWMRIIEDVFKMEGKERKDQERLNIVWRKSTPEQGRCFSIGFATLSGSVAVDEKRFVAAMRNSVGKKRRQKEK